VYNIVITQSALKDLEHINQQDKQRIAKKLQEYANNPEGYARKLINPKLGTYRFRMGDYRVIFDIEDGDIVILRIGHRKDIYK